MGFLALATVGVVMIPPLIRKLSNKLYQAGSTNESIDFENLGPEIVRKDDDQQKEE